MKCQILFSRKNNNNKKKKVLVCHLLNLHGKCYLSNLSKDANN